MLRTALVLVFALPLLLPGCRELLVDPAEDLGAVPGLSLSIAPAMESGSAAAQQAGEAFDRADGVQVRVAEGTFVHLETSLDFSPDETVRIVLPWDTELEEPLSATLLVTLTWQGQPLFRSEQSVTLAPDRTTEAEVSLEPISAGVEASPGSVLLEAIGAGAQLEAQAVFATGDPFPGSAIAWSSQDPGVASVGAGGAVTAVAPGTTSITATSGDHAATVTVEVRQTVAAVSVTPGSATLGEGGTVELTASVEDANGHGVEGSHEVAWSSSDPAVAIVDAEGRVEGLSEGTARITATVEGVQGFADIAVEGVDSLDFEGVWAYRPPFPGADTPDYVYFETDRGADVEESDGCYLFDWFGIVPTEEENVYLWFDDEAEERFEMYLESADVLFIRPLDWGFELEFRFDRTSLTLDDLQPVCGAHAAEAEGEGVRGLLRSAPEVR